jgi:hypothetical protein
VWVAEPDGSSPRRVARPVEALSQIAWLPGNALLYWARFAIYRLTLGGKSTLVARVQGERFSLDARGDRVATAPPGCPFCAGPARVDDLATGADQPIGRRGEAVDSPSLSPDGAEVAFRRYRCAKAESDCVQIGGIWIASTRGGAWRRLTTGGSCPIWSPDGKTILYLGAAGAIRLVPTAGGPSRLLLRHGRCSAAFPPSWSPDSREVALFQGTAGRLVTVDVATRRTRLATGSPLGVAVGFAWSPDSSSLLVAARPVPLACASLLRVDATTGASRLLRAC